MCPYGAREGQILVRKNDGEGWEWREQKPVTPHETRWVPRIIIGALVIFFVCMLISLRHARADSALPFGITCEQVVQYAAEMKIPNTWRGRVQARIIALSYGAVLTSRQLDAAARCLVEAQAAPK